MKRYIPKSEIDATKKQMEGSWLECFQCVAPELDDAVQAFPEKVDCPMPGCTSSFRFFNDAEKTGGGVCNSEEFYPDGFSVLQALYGLEFWEAVQIVQEWLAEQDEEDGDDDHDNQPDSPVKIVTPVQINEYALRYIDTVMAHAEVGHEMIKRYMTSRGITVEPPGSLGLMACERYSDGYDVEEFPVMVAPFHKPDDEISCMLRTYLDPSGNGKADVSKPKKFSPVTYKGAMRGGAIRLRPYKNGQLGIAEGIETAEAVYQATRIPTWAAGNAGNLGAFEPPADVKQLMIWADNDTSGTGQNAAKKLQERMTLSGVQTRVYIPPNPKEDWLDILVKYGRDEFVRIAKGKK